MVFCTNISGKPAEGTICLYLLGFGNIINIQNNNFYNHKKTFAKVIGIL